MRIDSVNYCTYAYFICVNMRIDAYRITVLRIDAYVCVIIICVYPAYLCVKIFLN